LREALAGTNHDFLLRDDKRSNGRRGRGAAKRSVWTRIFGGRRSGVIFIGLIAIAAIGIPLNALYLQEGRHPAPLFHLPQETSVETKPAHVAAPTPLPPARPPAQAPAQPAPAQAPAQKTAAVKSEPAQHVAERKRDVIGALLEGGSGKNDAGKSEQANKSVLAAQRALAKLGYAVRPDGVFGPATRQALEKFERDSGLQAKGELTAKVKRQLHLRSGLPVE
jgi:hypothetical protein